jgi:hypothetical protein
MSSDRLTSKYTAVGLVLSSSPDGFLAQFAQEKMVAGIWTPPSTRRANARRAVAAFPGFDFMHGHLPDFIQQISGVVPRLHSADKIAGELRVPVR